MHQNIAVQVDGGTSKPVKRAQLVLPDLEFTESFQNCDINVTQILVVV